ncbi:MAG: VWA domain-containing protein [Selenomonadaceae bacterium]|nr:VWA domain-containing protein [Selenomonadaceae bacterium]
MILNRGMRNKLEKYLDVTKPLTITLQTQGAAVYDYSCFCVNADDKLFADEYMIFYNQLRSPSNEIIAEQNQSGMTFTINLNALPQEIQKLVFTCSIDGDGTMKEISTHNFTIGDKLSAQFVGNDFAEEKAITSLEIYRKDGWRFNVVARGFDGGLSTLLEFYGGTQEDDDAPEKISQPQQESTSAPKKISLEKKIQDGAPKLISLVKPLKVELEKRNLQEVVARVALVMDISGSMNTNYKNGTVQEIVNKILPVAVQFDDDGELDFWYFGTSCERRPTVNMKNYEQAVPEDWRDIRSRIGGSTNELIVMREIVEEYKSSKIPAYVVFISDGGFSEKSKLKKFLIEASKLPIFWQFVGVDGSHYGLLEELDNLSGRYVDNTNFFALNDFRNVPNEKLYSLLLNEFPQWLKAYNAGKSAGKFTDNAQEKSFGDRVKSMFGF